MGKLSVQVDFIKDAFCPDFDMINQRAVINGKTSDDDTLPANAQRATLSDRDRRFINAGIFSKLVKTRADEAVIVFLDNVHVSGADEKNAN